MTTGAWLVRLKVLQGVFTVESVCSPPAVGLLWKGPTPLLFVMVPAGFSVNLHADIAEQ